MTDPVRTPHETAAFALAVHVRNAALEQLERELEVALENPDDDFAEEEWSEIYQRALECAGPYASLYPDTRHRVHQICDRLRGMDVGD